MVAFDAIACGIDALDADRMRSSTATAPVVPSGTPDGTMRSTLGRTPVASQY